MCGCSVFYNNNLIYNTDINYSFLLLNYVLSCKISTMFQPKLFYGEKTVLGTNSALKTSKFEIFLLQHMRKRFFRKEQIYFAPYQECMKGGVGEELNSWSLENAPASFYFKLIFVK